MAMYAWTSGDRPSGVAHGRRLAGRLDDVGEALRTDWLDIALVVAKSTTRS
jgi:hypothetical protein